MDTSATRCLTSSLARIAELARPADGPTGRRRVDCCCEHEGRLDWFSRLGTAAMHLSMPERLALIAGAAPRAEHE